MQTPPTSFFRAPPFFRATRNAAAAFLQRKSWRAALTWPPALTAAARALLAARGLVSVLAYRQPLSANGALCLGLICLALLRMPCEPVLARIFRPARKTGHDEG